METYGVIVEPGQSIRVTRYEPGPSAAHVPGVFLRRVSGTEAEAVICVQGPRGPVPHVVEIHLCQDIEGRDYWATAE